MAPTPSTYHDSSRECARAQTTHRHFILLLSSAVKFSPQSDCNSLLIRCDQYARFLDHSDISIFGFTIFTMVETRATCLVVKCWSNLRVPSTTHKCSHDHITTQHSRVIAYYYTRIDYPRPINQRSTSELEAVMTSVEVATPTVHLRLRPGGSPWSRSRVERQTRERASGTDSSNDLLLKPSGFIFKTFTVNARLVSHSALCLNKFARTNHLKRQFSSVPNYRRDAKKIELY